MDTRFILIIVIVVLAAICAYMCVWMVLVRKKIRQVTATLGELEQIDQKIKEAVALQERQAEAAGAQAQRAGSAEPSAQALRSLRHSIAVHARDPLASITGRINALANDTADEAACAEYLQTMHAQADAMQGFVDTLTRWLQLETDEQDFNFQLRDIVAETRATLEQWIPRLETAGFHCHSQLPEDPVDVLMDICAYRGMLESFLQNVLEHSGGDSLIAMLRRENGFLYVCIADNGAGISGPDLPHIFEPFYKADPTAGDGPGLGLRFASLLARKHGWATQAQNLPDGGAAFFLHIPTQS